MTLMSGFEYDRAVRDLGPSRRITCQLIDAELEIAVHAVTDRLTAGQVLVISPELPHSGRAITAGRVLDVFAPTRDEDR